MKTAHYAIYARSDDGESLDLVVEAESYQEAEFIWREWVTTTVGWEVPEDDFAIYSLPALTGHPHFIEWDVNAICMKDTRR